MNYEDVCSSFARETMEEMVKRRKLERQTGLSPQMREQAGMRYEDLLLRHINLSTSLSSQMREQAAMQYDDLCLSHIQLSRRNVCVIGFQPLVKLRAYKRHGLARGRLGFA
eukprot:s3521_g7.t1